MKALGEARTKEVPEALRMERAWVAKNGAANVIAGGISGVDGSRSVGPGLREEAGTVELELAGSEEF